MILFFVIILFYLSDSFKYFLLYFHYLINKTIRHLTANAATQAIIHCQITMPTAHFRPSSRRMEAIAAIHGVYNRLNTRSEAAATGANASFTAPPNKISRVEITLSFAITPLINEVQILQSPSPSGAKIGTRQFEIIARILSLESATRLKCKSNFCKNQIQIVATKITVNAFCRKSFAFSHKSCITFFSPGRR